MSPVTPEGRLIAVALMLLGIGFIGVFTATVTSFFLDPAKPETANVEQRLARIEEKVDTLLRDQKLKNPRVDSL